MRSNMKGSTHFTHLPYGILAIPRTAMRTPEVGVIILVNPSPNWNAITVACLLTPIISEKGAMIGIVMAALALADGMTRLMRVCMPYMRPRAPVSPEPSSQPAIECSSVSIIFPSCKMKMIPAARPTIRAAPKISFAQLFC